MDRTKSGIVDFGKNSVPHEIEAHDRRKTTSINYIDDFALATWAPIKKENKYALDIFIDKCSVEIFLNGGKIAMTNLVFHRNHTTVCVFIVKEERSMLIHSMRID